MKTLIYQVKVGPNPPAFYDTCINSVKVYCSKYGIDHIVQTEPLMKIVPVKSHRSENALRLGYLPIYEKENAFSYLDRYDQIAIVDSDIYIRDTAPNIFNELGEATFAAVAERDMPLTEQYVTKILNYSRGQYGALKDVDWKWSKTSGAEFYNMGLMLFSNKILPYLNGQTPNEFIKRKEFEPFVNGEGNYKWSTDQTLLNYWIKKSGMPVKNLNWTWNALFKGIRDEKLPQSHFVHFFLSNNLPQKGQEIPSIIDNLSLAASIKEHR